VTNRHAGPEGRRALSPRQRLATYALGLAGGLGVNTLSSDIGYRGAATAAVVAAILLSTNWLRQLPPSAPLVRMVSWALLGGAVIAAVLAAVSPRWEGSATIAATVLTTSALLIPALDKSVGILTGVAFIGLGVAVIGVGVAVLRGGNVLSQEGKHPSSVTAGGRDLLRASRHGGVSGRPLLRHPALRGFIRSSEVAGAVLSIATMIRADWGGAVGHERCPMRLDTGSTAPPLPLIAAQTEQATIAGLDHGPRFAQ
jgi:hypothetical protein